ncbi:hypothetical protein ACEWBC_17725 [Vibrio parahaemolyticus]|nr:hypothetical protein [Vibrio parahaemolyticus]
MGLIDSYEISIQLIFNFDMFAQVISSMSSEDFRNICVGISSLITAFKK